MNLKEKKLKNIAFFAAMGVLSALLIVGEIFRVDIFGEGADAEDTYLLATRVIGAALCLLLMFYCGYQNALKLRLRGLLGAVLFTLPCWAIAINNFPIIPFFFGNAYISGETSAILFYALQCLFVGLFEELAFRGCVFMMVLQGRRKTNLDLFWSIVISSAVFGALHVVNLLVGASSPLAVILQIGYSFLIGGMCSVVLMKTGSVWHCVLIHAVYNFCGGVVPRFGGGDIWTAPEIALTAVVAVAVAIYVIVALIKMDTGELDRLYKTKKKDAQEV